MPEKLRFGIVGCGVIGPIHAEAIASLPDAELISVVDINPEQAQKLADKYRVRSYTQLQHMLNNEPVDVVIICAPSGLHGELACQVMRSGRHVIVEKPLAMPSCHGGDHSSITIVAIGGVPGNLMVEVC